MSKQTVHGNVEFISDFRFLVNPKMMTEQIVEWKDHIFLTRAFDKKFVRSKVGIGRETTDFKLTEEFMLMLTLKVNEMRKRLLQPTKVMLRPHKIVKYEKGDFFKAHFDANHFMTLSVEIFQGGRFGGDLCFDNVDPNTSKKIENNNEIKLTLFYNDLKHWVSKVKDGKKMTIIFDILASEELDMEMIDYFQKKTEKAFEKLKTEELAMECVHIYMHEKMENHFLKGVDRIMYELLNEKRFVKFIRTARHPDRHGIFREELIEFAFPSDGGFNKDAMLRIFESQECVDKSDFLKEELTELETTDEFLFIADQYRLGNYRFLANNPALYRYLDLTIDNLCLGNEGMYSDPIHNLTFIAKREGIE